MQQDPKPDPQNELKDKIDNYLQTVHALVGFMHFFRFECCAKCTPCRVGTNRLYEIISAISEGRGTPQSLDELQTLGQDMELLSNCGLGQTASVAVRDILKHFRPEIEQHIYARTCPAGVCKMPELSPAELAAYEESIR